ncbi:MAG: BlaI/MecI/CopY family transcriptional regulator [Saprospiraceae bacterium]|nr:BlaI/MecI/CopY family transcriptional regulator [Saprospiraceae bacterium]
MASQIKLLTPLELKVMRVLWKIQKGFIKDILKYWPASNEEKPAYNTVSTIVRILQKEDKGFIGHKAHGRTHEYYPIITEEEYQRVFIDNAVDKVFSGSAASMLSTLVSNENMSEAEISELKAIIGKL